MFRAVQAVAVALTALLLVATGVLLVIERSWPEYPERSAEDNFRYGSIGTEIVPLPVMQVLPDLFPERFQPAGPAAGDWVDQFGFVRNEAGVNHDLPVGFAVSMHRPKSGAPSPVPFVGFSCALCHTAVIQTGPADKVVIVPGMGNHTLDLFAWTDALEGALLDEERLTPQTIARKYAEKFGRPLGLTERLVIRLWLAGARQQLRATLPRWDAPYDGPQLRDANFMPNGPSRTQPFRELVRFTLDRPAAADRAISKLPPVYRQSLRPWAQYDGSVRNPVDRSLFAAIAAGATVDNLALPDLRDNMMRNVRFTMDLRGPAYATVFPRHAIDPEKAGRGRAVYLKYCNDCHGHPEGDRWAAGRRQGEVIPATVVGTDPERVNFRYYEDLAQRLFEMVPPGHPFKPVREELRPGPLGRTHGYVNAPLDSLFSRVPYLHNGSVLTVAELINLRPRRAVFYRGRNFYDPEGVGLASPKKPDHRHYYRFDTARRGNSNRGHDYPWPYRGPGWDPAALADLLEYLKTF
jgi:hypothetical protein